MGKRKVHASKAVRHYAKKHVAKQKHNCGVDHMCINKSIANKPFPDRFYCVFKTTQQGSLSVIGADTNDMYFNVWANAPFQPFDTSTPIFGATFAGTESTNFAITDPPVGYTDLLNVDLYNNYKVHETKIKVVMYPTASTSDGMLTVVPMSNSTTQPHTENIASRMNRARSKICKSTDVNNYGISSKFRNHVIEGYTKAEYDAQVSGGGYEGGYNGYPGANQYWSVNYQPFVNATAFSAYIDVTVWHFCELFNINYADEAGI